MPFYNGTLFEIDRKEMLRYAGMNPKGKNFPEEAIQSAIREALALAEPKGIWQVIPYSPSEGKIEGNPPLVLSGNSIRHHLANSWSTAVLAVTVGDEIEKHRMLPLSQETMYGVFFWMQRPLPPPSIWQTRWTGSSRRKLQRTGRKRYGAFLRATETGR